MTDLFRLENRVALVTGSASGIGRAAALALAGAGADVACLDRDPSHATVKEIESLGRRSDLLIEDLADLDARRALAIIDHAIQNFGRIDVLVNAAGIIRRSPVLEMSEDDWRSVIDLDLTAVFFLCQAAGRRMTEAGTGGAIVQVASMLSFQGGVMAASYAAAKSGIAGLTRALANEWAALGIRVNAVAPGYIATSLTDGLRADADRSRAILSRIPAGRWGEPPDLAGAIVFLACDAAAYVHGIVLPVDGGWLAR